jgi:hypothetical protein
MAGLTTFDHEFYIGTTRKALSLMRDNKGAAMYAVNEEVPDYKKSLKFSMKDWSGGHGQYEFVEDDISFDGQSIDTTVPGKIILGPLINSVGITGPASLDASPTHFCWFAAIGRLMMATTEQIYWYDGTYWVSKKTFTGKTITHLIEYNGILYVALGSSDKYYFTSDGAAYLQTNQHDGYAERFFVSANSAATQDVLWKSKHANEVANTTDGRNAAKHADHVFVFTTPSTYVDYFSEVMDGSASTHAALDAMASTSYLYVGATDPFGRLVIDMGSNVNANASVLTAEYYNGSWTAVTITDGTIATGKTMAIDGSITFTVPADWATTTVNSEAGLYWIRFAVSATLSATMDVNEINLHYGATAASTGVEWEDPPNYIGDTSNDIVSIFTVGDKLMIGKTNNLFHLDTDGGVHPVADWLKNNSSTNNFKYTVDWQTARYFSLDTGLGEITTSSTYAPVGPLTGIGDIGKVGTCVGMGSDKDFLYVAMDEGTNTHIYKGREVRTKEDNLRWEWCPWIFVGTNACATAAVIQHSATDRRLWFGYGNNSAYVTIVDNPTTDTNARFCAAGWIRFSYTYGTNPYFDKLWQSIVTETKNCTAAITVTPKYRKDTDTSMTALSGAIITNGVVKTNLTTSLSSNRIQFELDLATGTNTITPEVTYFEVRGVEKPETIRVHDATYSIGTTPTRSVETLRSYLRGGRTSTSLIKFADLRYGDSTQNTTYTWVVFLPGFPEEVEILHEKGRPPESGIRVKFQEVSFTVS